MHVLIVGCGYVGLELGRRLTPEHRVTGVRRSGTGLDAVEAADLEAVHADATRPGDLFSLPSADVLVYAASAGRDGSAHETYVEGLRTVIDHFGDRRDPPEQLLYTSSTGVYGDRGGEWVDESTTLEPSTDREETLIEAERVARERGSPSIDRTIVRFGGIYGPDRSPVERYLSGPVSPGYANFVHRDDAAGALSFLIRRDVARDAVRNVVDGAPIERPALAEWIASRLGVDPPTVVPLGERDLSAPRRERLAANKRVANDAIRADGYEFAYPTVKAGIRDLLDDG